MEHVCACMYVCTGNMGTHSPTAVKPAGRDSACSRLGGVFVSFFLTYLLYYTCCMQYYDNGNNE